MYICKPRRATRSRGPCVRPKRALKSFEEIVADYLVRFKPGVQVEMSHYRRQPNLESAIRVSALAITSDEKRNSHQWRIPTSHLEGFRRELLRRRKAIQSCKTFKELMEVVSRAGSTIWKRGELTIYDTAHRIGEYLGIAPEAVYLHRGTRVGARALGLGGNCAAISPRELPEAFRSLAPFEIEDCLCIYADDLKALVAAR